MQMTQSKNNYWVGLFIMALVSSVFSIIVYEQIRTPRFDCHHELITSLYARAIQGYFDASRNINDKNVEENHKIAKGQLEGKYVVRIAFIYWLNAHSQFRKHETLNEVEDVIRCCVYEIAKVYPTVLRDPLDILDEYSLDNDTESRIEEHMKLMFDAVPFDAATVASKNTYETSVQEYTKWLNSLFAKK